MRAGHMPGSVSLQFSLFLQNNNVNGKEFTTYLPPDKIREALIGAVGEERAQAIIDGKLPVITSCGSGMTAAIVWLGLRQLGVKDVSLYDEVCTPSLDSSKSDFLIVMDGLRCEGVQPDRNWGVNIELRTFYTTRSLG